MKAHELDTQFGNGADVSSAMDWSRANRPNVAIKWVNVDLPTWLIERLDEEAVRRGVTRQALIELWIADRLKA